MTLVESIKQPSRLIEETLSSQRETLDPLAERIQSWLLDSVAKGGPSARKAVDFLYGTWLGHSLHPALTDVPIGAWTVAMLLDFTGFKHSADRAITVGVLAAVPTALAGTADWSQIQDKPRRIGLVHGLLNTAALGLYLWSLLARLTGKRGFGIGLSTLAYAIASGSAYLGGELVYVLGSSINRNAWRPEPADFQVAARESDLVEGMLTAGEITVEGETFPVVLLKRHGEILALNGVCSHEGGPLAEGTLVNGNEVVCPWHGSVFCMRDGGVLHGPASVPQPCYEVRVRNGNVEVRREQSA